MRRDPKSILLVETQAQYVYNFRQEIIIALIEKGYRVTVASQNYDNYKSQIESLGCGFITLKYNQHGMNPIRDFSLLLTFISIINSVKASCVLTYTTKPNIFASIACELTSTPYIVNITGIGTALGGIGFIAFLMKNLYRIALLKANMVFFQNNENEKFFVDNRIIKVKHALLPGSGVNLDRFPVLPYPEDGTIRFAFISRIIKEKGIDQYIETARALKGKAEFHVCGACSEEYNGVIEKENADGMIIYHGNVADIHSFLANIHCVVHPSYYPEGISNVLLEAMASARPIITTNNPGCCDCVSDGGNGLIVKARKGRDVINAVIRFIALSNNEKKNMGLLGRTIAEKQFDRQIIVTAYLNAVCVGTINRTLEYVS